MGKARMRIVVLVTLCGFVGLSAAGGGGADWAGRLYEAFSSGRPITDFPARMPLADAYAVQKQYVALLKPGQGRVVGYKAALTGPKQRQTMAVDQPVHGVLLAKMLYPNGSRVSVDFGVSPFMEGDFLVRVGSAEINLAKSRMEVLAGLDAVVPFIELVDLPVVSDGGINLPGLIAGNSGARKGVTGDPVPIAPTEQWMERLGRIEVELYEDDRLVSRGDSRQLYGHPVDAVIWLRDRLAAQGVSLKPGDLLSLGSVAGSRESLKAGTRLRVLYKGLIDGRAAEVIGVLE